jgi:hypothetical protein
MKSGEARLGFSAFCFLWELWEEEGKKEKANAETQRTRRKRRGGTRSKKEEAARKDKRADLKDQRYR